MDLALSQARQRHEAALRALRAQLSSQHVRKENVLTQQIRQLEERLVECLREQDRKGSGGGGGGGRGMGEVQQLFQATLTSLKKDVTVFVSLHWPHWLWNAVELIIYQLRLLRK